MRGLFILILTIIIMTLAAACGGGGGSADARLVPESDSRQVAPVTPSPDSNQRSRQEELARLDNLEPPEGVDFALWNDLKAALAALLPEKIVCTPPIGEGKSVTDLDFYRNEEGIGWLTWSYQLQGDYNVDGIVDVDDITPIAEHYGEIIGEENAWLALLDFSGNGIVDIADMTGIALNYACDLAGFTVLSSDPDLAEWEVTGTVARTEAETLEGGILLFSSAIEPEDWSDFAVLAYDTEGATGEISNVLEYRQPRIISMNVPTGKVGDICTASAVVEGEEPIAYDWTLGNGVSPNRSDEPSVEVELVQRGHFYGHLTVSNRFDERRQDFNIVIGVPPQVTSVEPASATVGERVSFSAEISGSEPITRHWNFGPSAFPQNSDEASPIVEFDDAGMHSCSLSVVNEYGSYLFNFQVETGYAPQIVKVTPARGAYEQQVQLQAEVLGTGPFSYRWTMNYWTDPLSSVNEMPVVTLTEEGTQLGKLVIENDYGEATKWFDFYVGTKPRIFRILWTSGTLGNVCADFFTQVGGDHPMTFEWIFYTEGANGGNDQPMSNQTSNFAVPSFLIPNEIGDFDGEVTVNNEFGSDTQEFTVTVDELFEVPV